jgi:phytoene dehydrogenase-like protein
MTENRDYDALIIGGGHNGLVCAGYLAKAGMKVLVVERRPQIGGAAVTEELFPGYRFSTCAYSCSLLQPKVIHDLELPRHGFEVYRLNPKRFSPYPDGRYLLLWDSMEESQKYIARFSRTDADAYPRWLSFWRRASGLIYPYFLKPPPSLDELKADVEGTDDAPFLERFLTVSMKELVFEFFENEAIRGAFISAQDAGDPAAPGSAWCYGYFRCSAFTRPEYVGVVKGGMGGVTKALASFAKSEGVTIKTASEVEHILVEDNTAIGIRLKDGTEITGRIVVSNADPKRTFLTLIDQRELPDDFVQDVSCLKTNVSYLKFHAALNRLPDFSRYFESSFDPRYFAVTKISPSVEYLEQSWNDASSGRPARAPVMEVHIPSVYDSMLAPAGHHTLSIWMLYAPVRLARGSWQERRQEVGEDMIKVLAQFVPDVKDCLVDWSLLTPWDLEQRVGLTEGNIRHLDTIPGQILDKRPLQGWARYNTPIRHLYLCGAGTHPGGDVSGAPGHNSAHVILEAHS